MTSGQPVVNFQGIHDLMDPMSVIGWENVVVETLWLIRQFKKFVFLKTPNWCRPDLALAGMLHTVWERCFQKKKKKALCDCHDLWLNSGHSCSTQPVVNFLLILRFTTFDTFGDRDPTVLAMWGGEWTVLITSDTSGVPGGTASVQCMFRFSKMCMQWIYTWALKKKKKKVGGMHGYPKKKKKKGLGGLWWFLTQSKRLLVLQGGQ